MQTLFIALYCLAAAVNVISCAAGRQTPRRAAKVLLMPLLAGVYLLSVPRPEPWVLPALAFGWLGDLFLIRSDRETLRTLGIAAFLAGHACYLIAMLRHFAIAPPLWACIAAPLAFLAAAAVIYRKLCPIIPANMKLTGGCYFLALAVMGTAAALVCASGRAGGVWLLAGEVLFLTSDTILCRQFFTVGDPAPKYDFAVMLTYILAQTCLILGFCS